MRVLEVTGPWKNRIVGTGEENPDQLLANPMNYRIHPKHQQDALGAVLDEVGWVDDVIVNKTTGHIVDGHLRVELALSRGEPSIPVKYVELTENEEKMILAIFDPISAMAVQDKEKLDELLAEVKNEDIVDMVLGREDGNYSIRSESIKPYKMTHILISLPPDKFIEIQGILDQIFAIPGIEVEQSSN